MCSDIWRENEQDIENLISAYVKQVIIRSRQKFDKSRRAHLQHEELTLTGEIEDMPIEFADESEDIILLERCMQCDYAHIENIFTEEKLYKTVKKLKLNQKFIMHLIYVANKSEHEVAEILAISRQRVNKIKNDALKKIITMYIKEGEDL